MSNPTMVKFGFPDSLVAETPHWVVLLRPQQPTLGALVLVCKEAVTNFGDASPAAFAELKTVVASIEAMLRGFVRYEKINYLMLMMVDPDVHLHVVPRYPDGRSFQGVDFPDAGWPARPDLDRQVTLTPAQTTALVEALRTHWPA